MNRDEIIKFARDAGITMEDENTGEYSAFDQELERFAEMVAAAEREECAKACDSMRETAETLMEHPDYSHSAEYERMCAFETAAERIRSRSKT